MTIYCQPCQEKRVQGCRECKRLRAADYYARNSDAVRKRARDYHAANRDQRRATHKAWMAANPNAHRRSYYRKAYGITPEQRDSQWAAQAGKCLLCDTRFDSIPERHVHVDHNHETGQPRGLLCHWCNTQMGTLEKSPDWIARALAYIARDGDWAVHSEPGSAKLKQVAA